MTQTSTEIRTLDRAPIVDDIVIIDPLATALFDVVALDDLYSEMIYVRRHATDQPAQWVFLTHVKAVDDDDPRGWQS